MYSVIHGTSPVGLPNQLTDQYGNLYSVYPTPAQATKMQEIAWQTVCDYQRDGVDCMSPPSNACTYLAYDGFDYTPSTAMEGLSGGTGWESPWHVQNADVSVPGYNSEASSLVYNDLQVTGNSGSGGTSYLTMGRRLDTEDSGPFADYVAQYNDGIGTALGDTLWTSFMLNKEVNNDQAVVVSMHDDNAGWCDGCATQRIAAGYFGSDSNNGGQRYWTLKLNDTYYQSSDTVVINQDAFFVVRTIFNAGSTQVDLYVNPNTIGNNGIPAATISQFTGTENVIRSLACYLGATPNSASIDEFRMATSYECVSPDQNVVVNLPPISQITMTPSSGTAPLAVTLNASGSTDPENQPLEYL